MLTTMNWEAPAGGVCTCCDKPIPPRRPSIVAQAKADRASLYEIKAKCRKYEGVITDGIQDLAAVRRDLELAEARNAEQAHRIKELERDLKKARRPRKDRRRYLRRGGEHDRLVHLRDGAHRSDICMDPGGATQDEQAFY